MLLTTDTPRNRPGKQYLSYDELPKVAQLEARKWAKRHANYDRKTTKAEQLAWAKAHWWTWRSYKRWDAKQGRSVKTKKSLGLYGGSIGL